MRARPFGATATRETSCSPSRVRRGMIRVRMHGEESAATLEVAMEVGVGAGKVDERAMKGEWLHLVAPSVSRTMLKLREAEYFLGLLQAHPWDQAAAHYHASAFAAALTAIPDVMDAECKGRVGYRPWRDNAAKRLHQDDAWRQVKAFRNLSTHRGHDAPHFEYGIVMREDIQGDTSLAPYFRLGSLGDERSTDVAGACRKALDAAADYVHRAEKNGFLKRTTKARGNTLVLDFEKEVSPGRWEKRDAKDLEMTKGLKSIDFGFSVNDGKVKRTRKLKRRLK